MDLDEARWKLRKREAQLDSFPKGSELRKIEKMENYRRFLDESYSWLERYETQGSMKRGIQHQKPYTSGSKESERSRIKTSSESKVVEIATLKNFDSIIYDARGFIIITDTITGNRVHKSQCNRVTRENFEKKVIENNCRYGRYYWTDDIEQAKHFGAKPCSFCKPSTNW